MLVDILVKSVDSNPVLYITPHLLLLQMVVALVIFLLLDSNPAISMYGMSTCGARLGVKYTQTGSPILPMDLWVNIVSLNILSI